MTIIRVTLNLAFMDVVGATLDNVRNQIIEHALDGFEAEVAFTSDAVETVVHVPDPDLEAGDAQVETWQELARGIMEGIHVQA